MYWHNLLWQSIYSFCKVNSFQGIYILRGPYLLYKLDVVILASVPFTGIHLVGCCALARAITSPGLV